MKTYSLTIFIYFTLDIYDASTLISSKTFAIQIGEPNLIKGENTVVWSGSNQLTIKLYNNGLAKAVGGTNGLSATLTTNNPTTVTINNGANYYNNINGANTQPNYGSNTSAFTFTVGTYNSNFIEKYRSIKSY